MIGLDPEFFVIDGSHHIVPAERFIDTGAKDAWVAYDNAAVELRPAACACNAGFSGNVRELLWDAVRQMRLARLRGEIPRGSEVSMVPSARLHDRDRLLKSVNIFGCEESLRVLADGDVEMAKPIVDPSQVPFRSAGYHTHVTLSNPEPKKVGTKRVGTDPYAYDIDIFEDNFTSKESCMSYVVPRVMLLDATLGLVDVMMNHRAGWTDQSITRRSVIGYGQAGEFRLKAPTKEGRPWIRFEYRTTSPWPLSSPMWTWWAVSVTRQVMTRTPKIDKLIGKLPSRSEVVEAINQNDNRAAEALWSAFLKVWDGHDASYRGGSVGDGLHELNLQYVQMALDNGGHTYYMPNWDYFDAWFRANREPGITKSERFLTRAVYGWSTNQYKLPTGTSLKTRRTVNELRSRHEGDAPGTGKSRYFPTGPMTILRTAYGDIQPPSWSLMVGKEPKS